MMMACFLTDEAKFLVWVGDLSPAALISCHHSSGWRGEILKICDGVMVCDSPGKTPDVSMSVYTRQSRNSVVKGRDSNDC